MSKRGRPLKFKTVKELENKIEEYFIKCEGEMLKNDEGELILNKWEQPIIINQKPPTVTGLALYLGFNGRQSLLNYQDKKEFMDTIMRAKSRIEEYAETRLYDKDGCNGAKFNLSNNFGWRDRTETDMNIGNKDKQPFEISQLTSEERKVRIEELKKKLIT